jgi:hypothetical protein
MSVDHGCDDPACPALTCRQAEQPRTAWKVSRCDSAASEKVGFFGAKADFSISEKLRIRERLWSPSTKLS